MLERRKKKMLPPREQAIVDACVVPTQVGEITHLLLKANVGMFIAGLYIYDGTTKLVRSLDDEMMGTLNSSNLNGAHSSNIQYLRHIPTWDQMVEDGDVKDLRTKKKEPEVPVRRSLDPIPVPDAPAPKRRSLS